MSLTKKGSSSRYLSHFLSLTYKEVVAEIYLTFGHELRKLLIVIFATHWAPTYKEVAVDICLIFYQHLTPT